MPALASLLGLPLAPVISPLLLSARLSKDELRTATAAFHRARGYHQALDFARFRESVLQEAFVAMPLLLMKRIFLVWSYLQEETGHMSLKEFLVGVAVVTKGTRDEQLRFVFQLMNTSGSQELSKSGTLVFLDAVATSEGKIVAVEDDAERTNSTSNSGKKKLWTVDAFADLLHPRTTTALGSELLTPAKFLKVLASRKFSLLYLLDWIPMFATQFQVTEVSSLQIATPCTSPANRDFKKLQQNPVLAVGRDVKLNTDREIPSIISPLELSAALLDTIRSECLSILDYLVSTGEEFATDTFQQRFSGILPHQIAEAVKQVDQLFPASASLSNSSDVNGSLKKTGRQRFKHLMLVLLSAFAKSAEDVVRLLFSIFDEESKGSLDVLQFAAFLRFASRLTHIESERMAFSMIGRLSGSLTSPPASPSGVSSFSSPQYEQDEFTTPSVSFAAFSGFFKSAAYREMELLSYPELEILHLIFHLQLSSLSSALGDKEAANGTFSAAIERNGLKQCTKQLRLAKSDPQRSSFKQNRFCLMERCKWNAIIEIVCDGNTEDVDDTEEIDDTHDSLANDIGVTVLEKKTGSDSTARANGDETDEFVLVPITLWVMLSFWQRTKLKRQATARTTHSKNVWHEWTTCVNFSSAPRTSDYQVVFQGFCVAVSLSYLALEGAEELQSSQSQAIVSETCSIQDLLDAVQIPNDVKRRRTSVRECQLVFDAAHNRSTRQTLRIPEEFRRIPLEVLMSTILPQDAQPESFRCFELQATAVEVSGCSNGEVEHQHMCDLPARESSDSSSNSFCRSARLNASTGLSSVHGLANLGNTCFMNSALQCLVVTPLLREYFLHQEYLYDMGTRYTASGNESPKSSNSHVFSASSNSNSPKRGKKKSDTILPSSCFLPLAFGQLVAEMNAFSSTGAISGVCDVISPEKMRNAIAMLFPHLSDGSQQDAQEFLSSLLSSLGEELRRQSVPKPALFSEENSPSNSDGISILSPQSRAFLSRLPSFSRSYQESSGVETTESASQKQLQFQVSDSNGRPDSTVANEWWISHLVSEPSIFTALFCGQFKSVLTCNVCGMKSARFEPFSSLQLPIVDENGSSVMTSSHSRRMVDMVVIVHFAQPSAHSGSRSLRLTVQIEEDWTLDQLLMKLQQDHEEYSLDSKRHYLACVVDGCRIQTFVGRDTLLMTISSALDMFELENIEDDADANESSQTLLDRAFHTGDELLVWTSDDRFVKGVVTSVRRSSPRSVATRGRLQSAHSLLSPSPTNYDVVLSEGLSAGKTMRAVSRVRPVSTSTSSSHVLFFRFVHRRQVLVPFYCKSPQRLALCGVPSVHRAHALNITGKLLYRVAQERFLPQFATRTFRSNSASSRLTNTLVIRRVRADGKCCSRCHWTAQCVGCVVPRSSDMIEDLEMDDTFSIDWNLEPFAGADNDGDNDRVDRDEIEWLLTQGMLSIDDHASYVSYRQTSSHSLDRSLKILCNSETLEAKCSACQTCHQHQTESCRDGEEKRASSSQQGPLISLHTKELSLWSVPPILIIQLKRFELSAGSYSWEKVNHCVDFPIDNLDLAAFLGVEDEYPNRPSLAQEPNSQSVKRAAAFLHTELNFPLDTASRDCTGYSLYGIVNHMGDIGSGHYTAHIKHPESDDWWLADDAVGLPVNIQKLTPSSAAYLLFYVRHDLLPPSSIAAGDKHVNGSSAAAATAFYERKRLSTFFPRQKHAVKLSDAAIQGAWQNETWHGAKERSGSNLQSSSSGGGDKSRKCNFM